MAGLPLEGIRILDHTIAWAGPQGTVVLADLGAEVIKIEALFRFDGMRYHGIRFGMKEKFWEKAPWFIQVNHNKLGITLDLSKERGKELYLKLVRISDVVINNFTPRVMPNLGLDYEQLCEVNPEIIMVSMPGYGCTGPYAHAPAFGDCINAFCGLDEITGYEDSPPMRPGIAYGDPTGGFSAALAVLSALHYRFKTGKGQCVDVSHFEASTKCMDWLLDVAINRRVRSRVGNRDDYAAPQGCYPCKGDDKWAAISITCDEEWRKFGGLLGLPDWSSDPRFATSAGRREHHDELDKHIAAWTSLHDRYEVMDLLQKAGLASAPMLYPGELPQDPHFASRGFFEEVDHPYAGKRLLPGVLAKMSESDCRIRFPAPLLGQHNEYVYQELLGLTDDEMDELAKDGIIGTEPSFADDRLPSKDYVKKLTDQ